MSNRVIGVDFGTSTSAVAAMDHGQARILVLDERERVLPTCVSLTGKGDVLVGAVARDQLEANPEFTFTGLKRLLGRRADDPQIVEWSGLTSYEIAPGPKGEAYVRGPDRLYSPVELCGHVFKRLREIATQATSEEITKCVIGIPAHFDLDQKEAVRQAARNGGLEPVRLLPEPIAAAVAYGVERAVNRTIAVYDLGGGTFDISILKITGQKFQTLSSAGDPFLGGEDFDQRVADWLVERFKAKHGVDLRDDPGARNRVRIEAEKAKESLSAQLTHRIFAKYIAHRPHLLDLDEVLEREEYESLVGDLIDRTKLPCREALKRAGVDVRDIGEVVLVGGMTRTPMICGDEARGIPGVVREIFDQTPTRRIDPVAAVALGCALQGAALSGDIKSVSLKENTVMAFSVQVGNGALVPLIRANTQLPARGEKPFGLADREADAAAIRVFHGNRQVMSMVMNGLRPPKGEPLVRVTLDVNEDGMLAVIARNQHTKEEIGHKLHAESGMSEAEVENLKTLGLDEFSTEQAA